jgi:hypothetical protein
MQSVADILKQKQINPKIKAHNKYEFQAYGNRLAEELNDEVHRALYIKLAKTTDRKLLDAAREFVLGSEKATTKGKLFMWKLAQLKEAQKSKELNNKDE